MTTPSTSCRITIFEGADGSGKTTAARKFAEQTGARYVHFGAFPDAHNIARFYVEGMLPALLGYQDVVMDRSWFDEQPYGAAFRHGSDRIGDVNRRILMRLALRCGALVVTCCPPWELVKSTYLSRRHIEYLENEQQLRHVYDYFLIGASTYPLTYPYDWTKDRELSPDRLDVCRTARHPLALHSAGNWHANTVLVGDSFTEPKEADTLYQWPFASLGGGGCSQWLTSLLMFAGVPEHELLWVNADQPLENLTRSPNRQFIALGDRAAAALDMLGVDYDAVPHPNYWRAFHPEDRYPLIDLIAREEV